MKYVFLLLSAFLFKAQAQQLLNPDILLKTGRVRLQGLSKDQKQVVYSVTHVQAEDEKKITKHYVVSVNTGQTQEIKEPSEYLLDKNISPDQKYRLYAQEVKIHPVAGKDYYPTLKNSNVLIYNDLSNRHWDAWEDGSFSHVFYTSAKEKKDTLGVDLMPSEAYDCPQQPFGGDEDYLWAPDSKSILYVAKKKQGKDYALSTNTDIYRYFLDTKKTINLTQGYMGYDVNPLYSSKGDLAWLSMARDGYESDKNDITLIQKGVYRNLTKDYDLTVNSFLWHPNGDKIYFNSPIDGAVQVYELDIKTGLIQQISSGDYDFDNLSAVVGDELILTRTDMNHAAEIFALHLKKRTVRAITAVNQEYYQDLKMCKVERRLVPTTDGKNMLVYVVLPPDFDANKKYPALLYCQGGPQSAITQYYSFRWNFALMASQGYIVIAPCRRGMPGFGVEWNEQISKDYGNQCMQDYLSAVDEVSKSPYVDKDRIGCIGASFGGYSVYYLAGIHQNRFKSFIAHAGIFELKSMYATTEELFFVNWDFGGPYWDKNNTAAQKTYQQYDPSNLVDRWNTPMLILHGEKDYRVPFEQGLQAFQAAQLKGLKSRLVLFKDENHWILKPHNALLWHREFFSWLKETL